MIDSNVLVSAAIFQRSIPWQMIDLAFERDTVLSSSATRNELREVFRRSKFDRYCSLESRMQFLEDILEDTISVKIVERIQAARDRKDDKFLELAVNGSALLLITGDADLLSLNPFRGIEIITPAAYLAR